MKLSVEFRAIGFQFRSLAKAFSRMAAIVDRPVVVKANGQLRKKPALSRKRLAEIKLQGEYMGTMRGLKPMQVRAVKKLRAEKGIAAAIREARRLRKTA